MGTQQPTSNAVGEYVLGTHDEELARLGLQHNVWRAQACAIWERAGFAPGQTLLDVGCGPGFTTLDLATLVGSTGKVLAADLSPRYIEHVKSLCAANGIRHVEPRVCDLHEMELPPDSLDGAYTRWVLCFVADPERIIARVAKALKPGAAFAIQDYYNYRAIALSPRGPALERVIHAVAESWNRRGGDCDIGRRLPGMLRRSGLRVREVTPVLRAARPGSSLWQWPEVFFRIYIPALIEMGLLTPEDQRNYHAEWAERSADPDAYFTTPPLVDIIAVK